MGIAIREVYKKGSSKILTSLRELKSELLGVLH
jgi:hypothetical protein